jgi:nitrile hydratase
LPKRVLRAENVAAALAKGSPCDRAVTTKPRFKAGDHVRTHNFNPTTHTRLPRYARDKVGIIEVVRDGFVFPDSNAHDKGENPQFVYTVVFTAPEIWGDGADPALTVSIDAWESYLEPA